MVVTVHTTGGHAQCEEQSWERLTFITTFIEENLEVGYAITIHWEATQRCWRTLESGIAHNHIDMERRHSTLLAHTLEVAQRIGGIHSYSTPRSV
ncbi:hypothetical protein CYMTET_53995 [Cymbomonas tetramitiformis]|uniref:Uncharacterized protein n=1 Tax=Cymbomonas tetramitiformis TaxID=36881 RepID=A0AAE0EPI4_9CHLO|nr:hypothetical protein CYMTET_53995 [Cymbomonas tetramitiformis]